MIFNVGSGGAGGSEVRGYWWNKQTRQVNWKKHEQVAKANIYYESSATTSRTFYYYDDFIINDDLSVSAVGTVQSVTFNYNTYTNLEVLKGKYFSYASPPFANGSYIYYCPPTSEITRDYSGSYREVYITNLVKYLNAYYTYQTVDYVHDMDINAYPNGGTAEDGYYYGDRTALLEAINPFDFDKYELIASIVSDILTKTVDLTQYKYFMFIGDAGSNGKQYQIVSKKMFSAGVVWGVTSLQSGNYKAKFQNIGDTQLQITAEYMTGLAYGMK